MASGNMSFRKSSRQPILYLPKRPGFKKAEHKGVVINTQEFVTLDIKMEVGQVTESVMVTARSPRDREFERL